MFPLRNLLGCKLSINCYFGATQVLVKQVNDKELEMVMKKTGS